MNLIGLDQKSSLPYFLELLSVKDSGFDQISPSPEGKKERMQEAFRRIVLKGSESRRQPYCGSGTVDSEGHRHGFQKGAEVPSRI